MIYLEKFRNGDIEARNKLVEHNLRLVAHIIKKYYSTSSEQDDLVSIGTIGLIKAVDTYSSKRSAKLATYAARCIENEIRSLAVAGKVSPIATVPEVRNYVDKKLREFGRKKRIVMDGRDIGTTVFPDAELKIFMTADPMVRAQRRAAEMPGASIEDVLKNLEERDYIDSHREVSPLTQAEDAVVLDNSDMTMQDQVEWLKALIAERFSINQ